MVLFREFIEGDAEAWGEYGDKGIPNPKFAQHNKTLQRALDALQEKYNLTPKTSLIPKMAAPPCEEMMVYAHYKNTKSRLFLSLIHI